MRLTVCAAWERGRRRRIVGPRRAIVSIMEQIWAPWRMAYINADSPNDQGCFLCTMPQQRDDEANLIAARGERCFVILNRFPYNNGHLMIAPYQHVPTIEHLDVASLTEMMTLAQRCLAALRTAMHPDGFNMGINQGKVAGAGLADHVHFHVVPRWNGDTNFMPVLADVKVMPDVLQNTYRQIRDALEPLLRSAHP
jgi:ATP adenylyltransferase